MPYALYQQGTRIKAGERTEVLAEIIAPYFNSNSGWDGIYPHYYLPPNKATGLPALTINGNIAHFSHPVFGIYYNSAPIYLKALLENVIGKLTLNPLLRMENFPAFARAALTAQGGRRIVHLLSYLPEKRGKNMQVIEEPVELHDVIVSLQKDRSEIKKVYLAPGRKSLDYSNDGQRIAVKVPVVNGYAMVIFE